MSDTTNETYGAVASLTADIVLFAQDPDAALYVLLIRRGWEPFAGSWALPGGYVDPGETFEKAARRELVEETGITAHHLTRVGVYDAPDRDPRGRVVSVAFAGVTAVDGHLVAPTAGDDATDAAWVPYTAAVAGTATLAFDHAQILTDAYRAVFEVSPNGGKSTGNP